jgi:16S rRNA (adenine1518-N6/adenine1519-N6)-dimethyltransferase
MDRVSAPPGAVRAIELAAAGFNQRRKMLRRSLAGVFDDPVTAIRSAGLNPMSRAEDLTPAEFLKLALS